MRSVANYLVAGMDLKALPAAPESVPVGTRCALEGVEIETGYPISEIVPDSAGEFLDMMHGNLRGYLSENAARAFKGTWNMGSWLIFEDGTGYHLLINREEAIKQRRPCWSDVVRMVWPSQRGRGVLAILTTDVKKRVWTRARVGTLGRSTPVFLHDGNLNLSGVFNLDWVKMVDLLNQIEIFYDMGFSKSEMIGSMLKSTRMLNQITLRQLFGYEALLTVVRGTPEFNMAILIAQKGSSR